MLHRQSKTSFFLQQKLKPKNGNVIELNSESDVFSNINEGDFFDAYKLDQAKGKIIGNHNGAHYYTIGQRKGLQIGGTPKPLFVIGTNTEQNVIYVGQGENHKGLYRKGLIVKNDDIHWIREDQKMNISESRKYLCRIRYRQALTEASFTLKENGMEVLFKEDQRGITPGQFIAWYEKDELIGSGVIH
jgi:tRNA-specific 2-thiouridylase